MKRFLTLMAIAALGLVLVACNRNDEENDDTGRLPGGMLVGDNGSENGYGYENGDDWDPGDWDPTALFGNPDPALVALMAQLYEGVNAPPVENWELTSENFYNFLMIDYIPGSVGVASQAMINVIPHAVVLLEVPAGMDASAIAADIEANADPARWICVFAEKMAVFHVGQFIVMAMGDVADVDAIGANVPNVLR